ncbi:MAG TPA: sulfatase [Draconibacterium sp.]|nr:sulfatase [Draconibacterium sp.]
MNTKKIHILAFAMILAATITAQNKRPNIILFIADDVSWNDLGCYGNLDVQTPNIDKLAAQGIRFDNFFLTASSCSPSRNSIITGRYPHNTGACELHTEPPLEMISFPEILKQNGYYTAQSGKFHMGKYAMRGFDVTSQGGKIGDGGEELWLETIQNRPMEKPFFMWFAALDAHRAWGPNIFSGTHDSTQITPPYYLANEQETKTDLARYYDEIARFDDYIGIITNELKKQDVLDNTLILIMADNGRPFPHSKTRVNDRGMKTPFIAFWPAGIGTKMQECNSLVSAIDIAPTILELAGAKTPELVQGVSFSKLFVKTKKPFRNYVFAEHNWHDYEAHERMVRTKDYLFILNSRPQLTNLGPADAVGSPSYSDLLDLKEKGNISAEQSEIFLTPRPIEELYYNIEDPEQFNNLAFKGEYANKQNQLKKILVEWMKETGDDIPMELTTDWYEKIPGYVKTVNHNIRGEMPGMKNSATKNNNKGKF